MPKLSFPIHAQTHCPLTPMLTMKRWLFECIIWGYKLPDYVTISNNKHDRNLLTGFRNETCCGRDGRTRPSVKISVIWATPPHGRNGRLIFTFREPSWMMVAADSSET